MTSKLKISFLLLLFNILLRVNCTEYFECIDSKLNLQDLKWTSVPDFEYAENQNNLPDKYKELDGQGIFYFVGKAGTTNYALAKKGVDIDSQPRTFIYLKYYGDAKEITDPAKLYVLPSISGGPIFLKLSSNFIWDEAIIELNPNIDDADFIEFGAALLPTGAHLFIDRFAVLSGYSEIPDVKKIEELCWPITTTTTTEPETTTVDSSSTTLVTDDPTTTTRTEVTDDPVTTTTEVTDSTTESTTQKDSKKEDEGFTTFKMLLYIVIPGIIVLAIVLFVMYSCKRYKDSRKQDIRMV